MEDQLTKLVDKVWEKYLQTPADRRLCKCFTYARSLFIYNDPAVFQTII